MIAPPDPLPKLASVGGQKGRGDDEIPANRQGEPDYSESNGRKNTKTEAFQGSKLQMLV